MIGSAQEFYRLRTSGNPSEYYRAAHDEAPLAVWLEVISLYPDMREWVAHNKTVPVAVLEMLSHDASPSVRCVVASKRKLPEPIQLRLAQDADESVHARLAHNAKATRRVLEHLLVHATPELRAHVQERLDAGAFEVT